MLRVTGARMDWTIAASARFPARRAISAWKSRSAATCASESSRVVSRIRIRPSSRVIASGEATVAALAANSGSMRSRASAQLDEADLVIRDQRRQRIFDMLRRRAHHRRAAAGRNAHESLLAEHSERFAQDVAGHRERPRQLPLGRQ